MNLNDYINDIKNPPRRPDLPPTIECYELEAFNELSDEKKELLREVLPYFEKRSFRTALERYEANSSEYAYYQTCSDSGYRALARVKICDFRGNYCYPYPVSAEKFYKEYSKGKKVGSQKYTSFKIQTHYDVDGEDNRYTEVYYTEDGGVFLTTYGAEVFAKMTDDEVGLCLARVCINLEEQAARLKKYRENQRRRK